MLVSVTRPLFLVLLGVACARSVAVETRRAPASTSEVQRCTAQSSAATADSQNVEVRLAVRAFDPDRELSRDYREMLSMGVRQFIAIPMPLQLDTYDENVAANGGDDRVPGHFGSLTLNATYRTMLSRDGRLLNSRAVGGATTPSFDRAVLDALVALDTSRLLPAPPTQAKWFRGDVAELVGLVIPRELARAPGKIYPGDTILSVPLLTFRTPIERLDRNVRRKGGPPPRYPPEMQMNAVEANVVLQFVVDADGRADMTTLQVLPPVPPLDFVKSALASVTLTHFDPMVIRGCAVRSLVQQPFVFGINGR
jgi:hypothetical protein